MIELADADAVVRDWLRSIPELTAVVPPERVYFALPEQDRPTLPLVVITRTGGAVDDQGFDQPLITLEAWAVNKFEASRLALLLAASLVGANANHALVDSGYVCGGGVDALHPVPGAPSWAKRYAVTGWLMLRR